MVATKEIGENKVNTKASKKQTPANTPVVNESQSVANLPEQGTKVEAKPTQGVERTRTGRIYTPAVDIYETKDAVILVADMPGVDENSVDVSLEKNVLTIYGQVEPPSFPGYSLAYAEYGIGDYQRSFTISNAIAWEHIEGVVKNGVLSLTLPKAGPVQAKKIQIKSQ